MISKDTLDFVIYGKAPTSNGSDEFSVLGISTGLNPQDAAILRGLAAVEPVGKDAGEQSLAVGVFKGPDTDFILAWARNEHKDGVLTPIYRYVIVPRDIFQLMSGSLDYLIDAALHIPSVTTRQDSLDPLDVPPMPTWTADKRATLLEKLLNDYMRGDMQAAFRILGAALDDQRLLVRGFEPELHKRLEWVQALMMLLPASVRSALTFSTNVKSIDTTLGRIIFGENGNATKRHIVEWNSASFPDDPAQESPYIELLRSIWNGDLQTFMMELRTLDTLAQDLMPGKSLHEGLDAVANRYLLNQRVLTGDPVSGEELKNVLQGSSVPEGTLRDCYVERLLDCCLEERDPEAADLVAPFIERGDELSTSLQNKLTETLDSEPDAVYSFVRTQLTETIDDYWLQWLHSAAVVSLKVAITDGDTETLMSWFRLISREPANYDLARILYDGILATKERAYQDSELASRLLLFTSRRAPHLIDNLLDDEAFFAALPEPIGTALRDYEPDAVELTIELGKEISLVLLGRAAQDAPTNEAAAAIMNANAISHLWDLYTSGNFDHLLERYQPVYIIDTLVADGVDKLSPSAVETLLKHAVMSEETDLFRHISSQLVESYELHELLITIYQNSSLPPERVIVLTNHLVTDETLTEQQSIEIYRRMAGSTDWDVSALPLVEQIARTIHKKPDLNIPMDILWRMLNVASETKTELVARVVTRRILMLISDSKDENQPVDTLLRLHDRLQWNSSVYGYVINWLRDYVQKQPISRLQQIKKALEGKKALDEVHAIVETTVAVRKMMGNRTLEEFSNDINTTFAVLGAISDSFDPINRQPIDFDAATVRAELDGFSDGLTPDERSVLAKNLKELAQLIITMSDHRRKATLIRSEENIERQLFTGEQHPQSAIDTMKWLSGYLNGIQDKLKHDE